jgi:uridine kinase
MSNPFTLKIGDKELHFEKKVKLLDLIEGDQHRYICATVNNHVRDLNYEVFYDAQVDLLDTTDYNSIKIYERSLRYIVAMAAHRAFPKYHVKFSYNVSRSIYLTIVTEKGKQPRYFNASETKILKQHIDSIVQADFPLVKKVVPNDEAKKIYKERGQQDKIDILKYRPEKTVHLYDCDGYLDYMYGVMVPSTGHIKDYKITLYGHGIIIQYPRSEEKGKIPAFEDDKVFADTLRASYKWAKMVKADTIASINKHVEDDGPIDFINMCEQHHNNMLAEVGNKIKENADQIKLICIAGPSSSGKTTFANRLRVELMSLGLRPIRISIDDYYLPKSQVPLNEDGKPDLECLEALDVELFNQNMCDLINGEEVTLPKYDFKLGKQVKGRTLKLSDDQPLIIEGIHALNEKLTSSIARSQKFKIFIAPQAQINLDNHNPISLTDLRLMRRIVRDFKFRNASAEETISMWKDVRRGEFKWIYKTQENADYVFNSLQAYELCVLKKYALPLLKQISIDSDYFPVAERLIRSLKYFVDMDDKWIPNNSIIREFIGGSCFQDV